MKTQECAANYQGNRNPFHPKRNIACAVGQLPHLNDFLCMVPDDCALAVLGLEVSQRLREQRPPVQFGHDGDDGRLDSDDDDGSCGDIEHERTH